MSIVITIAGVNRTSLIDWKSFRREDVLTRESNKLSFMIKKFGTQTYKPNAGDEIIVTINSIREFAGFVTEITENIEGRLEYIRVNCKDYTHSLDRFLVSKTYESMTVNAIIADIIANFTDGTFTGANVNCTTLVNKIQFNYLPVSKCLEKLTQNIAGYDWYVDYNKDIHFFVTSVNYSTYNLTDISGNYVFGSLEIKQDTNQLRNDITVRGGITVSTTTRHELLSGDGGKYIFPLATKYSQLPSLITVTVGGVPKSVGIENVDVAGFDVYWNYTEKSLKFIVPPGSGTNNIDVEGYYEYPLIVNKTDQASIATYGVYQFAVVDKTLKDIDVASMRASVELAKYAQPLYSATFRTYTYGLKAGQYINIQSAIRGLDKYFKIQSITSTLTTPTLDTLEYKVNAVTTEDLGINDILTRLLITNTSDQIETTDDEYISRIRQFTDTLTITDNTPTASKTSAPYLWDTPPWDFFTWS